MAYRVVNAYEIHPDEIQTGDQMMFVVKAIVVRPGVYRLYRCPYDGPVLQGSRIGPELEPHICEALFPTLQQAASPDRW